MRRHVTEGLHQQLFGNVGRADALVDLRGLQETPGRGQPDHVVVNQDRGVDDLARRGIDPRRPHRILDLRRHVTDAGIFEVVGIERGVVGREIPHLDGIGEPDPPESVVPAQHTAADGSFPGRREEAVEVEHDRLDGLHPLPAGISRRIGGLQPPAVGQRVGLRRRTVGNPLLRGEEHSDTLVGDARLHLLFGQQQQRALSRDGQRMLVIHRHAVVLDTGLAREARAHRKALVVSPQFEDRGQFLIRTEGDLIRPDPGRHGRHRGIAAIR